VSSAGHSAPSAMMALILQLPGLHLRNVTSPVSHVCVCISPSVVRVGVGVCVYLCHFRNIKLI
jgi:hypothetical protein